VRGRVPNVYWWALGGAAVLLVLSRTQQGQVALAGATDAVMSSVLGLSLNNPLNVERGDPWDGLAPSQPHARFAKFISMPYGIRAAARILINYRNLYGIKSVRGIIDRWNPISDGQPPTYKPNVAAALGGISIDAFIDVRSRAIAFPLVRVMIRQEIGAPAALLVSDEDVHAGLTLAGIA
jgi:hypothetical protein